MKKFVPNKNAIFCIIPEDIIYSSVKPNLMKTSSKLLLSFAFLLCIDVSLAQTITEE